ncbi:MAG: DUF4058 family protein [Chloroflexota bacterium]
MTQRYPPSYIQHRQRGPFPGHMDPWAEAARYFQQIHSGMIHNLQDQLQDTLIALGYQAGKEASLQIMVILADSLEIEALHITDMDSGELVTVVEIISPRNKTHPQEMALYREQRARVFLDADVNVVEVDATRSYARLLAHKLAEQHAYHIAGGTAACAGVQLWGATAAVCAAAAWGSRARGTSRGL